MTNKEAVETLHELHDQCCQADSIFCTDVTGARCDAVDMAISALEGEGNVPDANVGDTISRQAAIDALTEYGNGRSVYIGVEEAVRRIEQLPHAQPTEASCWGCSCPKMERLKEQKTFSEMVHLHDAETHDKRTKTHACDLIDRQAEIEKLREYVGLLPHDLTDIADKAIDALASQQRWIPCSERLPDEYGDYLVTEETVGWNMLAYGTTDIAYFDTVWHKADKVLAWMPLPEPYQGKRKGAGE